MKIYLQGLTYFIKPEIWLFYIVVLQTTAKKWTKVKNSHAGHVKLLFWPTYCVVHNSSSAIIQTSQWRQINIDVWHNPATNKHNFCVYSTRIYAVLNLLSQFII